MVYGGGCLWWPMDGYDDVLVSHCGPNVCIRIGMCLYVTSVYARTRKRLTTFIDRNLCHTLRRHRSRSRISKSAPSAAVRQRTLSRQLNTGTVYLRRLWTPQNASRADDTQNHVRIFMHRYTRFCNSVYMFWKLKKKYKLQSFLNGTWTGSTNLESVSANHWFGCFCSK